MTPFVSVDLSSWFHDHLTSLDMLTDYSNNRPHEPKWRSSSESIGEPMTLNTAVVCGRARQNRQGIKVARFIVRQLQARDHQVHLVDSKEAQLPMLDNIPKMFRQTEDQESSALPHMEAGATLK